MMQRVKGAAASLILLGRCSTDAALQGALLSMAQSDQTLIFLITFILIRMGKHKATILDFFLDYVEEEIVKKQKILINNT